MLDQLNFVPGFRDSFLCVTHTGPCVHVCVSDMTQLAADDRFVCVCWGGAHETDPSVFYY